MNNLKNILIVEDEVMLSNWLKMQLEDEGYIIVGAFTSGEEAIEFVRSTKPDLILMDIVLAGKIDGIETAEKIRETSAIPIIFMTGYDKEDVFNRSQKINPLAYLTKPVEIWDIKSIIESSKAKH